MPWPPRVGGKSKRRKRGKSHGIASPSAVCEQPRHAVPTNEGSGSSELPATTIVGGGTTGGVYACHYCQRTDGRQTRDHKVPKAFGGTKSAANIVRCCLMCNTIKESRPYALFVLLFGEFLDLHGEEYRAADPDDGRLISKMHKKFSMWLHALQHAEDVQNEDHVAGPDLAATAGGA